MIRIEVTGDRGQGKTVTALRIVHMLRGLGFQAEYHGATEATTRLLRDQAPAELASLLDESSEPREFQVIDRT